MEARGAESREWVTDRHTHTHLRVVEVEVIVRDGARAPGKMKRYRSVHVNKVMFNYKTIPAVGVLRKMPIRLPEKEFKNAMFQENVAGSSHVLTSSHRHRGTVLYLNIWW